MTKEIGTIEEALRDIKEGKVILVIDDPDRENEGDLICAAEYATQANINFMATHAKGLICTPMSIEQAAKLAGADEFIRKLPHGYDSYIGERGVKLSGGQKQRLSIARVFLKDPKILLLDEATSALDNESEVLVGRSLDKLAHGRTTLTIAHRLTTIRNADRILVLGRNSIEEEGTHEQLLANRGLYYRLWNGLVTEE